MMTRPHLIAALGLIALSGWFCPAVTPPVFASAVATRPADIASKLATDKFVAAKLADAIIDSGKYKILIPNASSDRSELRMQLVGWIQENPDSAAQLYRAGQNLPDTQTEYVVTGAHQVTRIKSRLKPGFIKLVNDFAATVKNARTPEQLAVAGDKLFLGANAPGTDAPGAELAAGPAAGAQGYKGFRRNQEALDELPALDWRMNPDSINREVASSNQLLLRISQELDFDRAIAAKRLSASAATPEQIAGSLKIRQTALAVVRNGKTVGDQVDEIFAQRAKLLDSATQSLKNFQTYLGQFVSRKQVNADESALLEKLRLEVRFKLAKLQIAAHMDHLVRDNAETALLSPELLRGLGLSAPAAAGYSAAGHDLTAEANALKSEYNRLIALTNTGQIALPELYARINTLAQTETQWRYKWLIFVSLPAMAKTAAAVRPQPTFDYLAQQLFAPRYPGSRYIKMLESMATYRKALAAATKAVEHKDFTYALDMFAAAEGGTPAEGVSSVARQIDYNCFFINRTRDRAELLQIAFFEGPFFRPAAPLLRRGIGLIGGAAKALTGA